MTKVAILIDGGFFLKRLRKIRPAVKMADAVAIRQAIHQLVNSHLQQINQIERVPNARSLLYRVFYYDAYPYQGKEHRPVSGQAVNFADSETARFRLNLFQELRSMPNTAVRLGEVRRIGGWALHTDVQKRLLQNKLKLDDLRNEDFKLSLQQKSVDMRLGINIYSLTLKKTSEYFNLSNRRCGFCTGSQAGQTRGCKHHSGSPVVEHWAGPVRAHRRLAQRFCPAGIPSGILTKARADPPSRRDIHTNPKSVAHQATQLQEQRS